MTAVCVILVGAALVLLVMAVICAGRAASNSTDR